LFFFDCRESKWFGIDYDQTTLHPEQDQISVGLDIERIHDVVLVEFHGFFAQAENRSYLFDWSSFGEQLHNIALSFGQVF
jgi:hypothetical protein